MCKKLGFVIVISVGTLLLFPKVMSMLHDTPLNIPVLHSDDGNDTLLSLIEDLIEPMEVYWNVSLVKGGPRHSRQVNFDDKSDTTTAVKGEPISKKYRRFHNNREYPYYDDDFDYSSRPHGRRGGRGYGGGSFAFASAGGGRGGGWASGGNEGGGYGYKGKGWNSRKGGGNNHYNPSTNKYGGGGPLSFVPGKGVVPHGGGGSTSSSSASASAGGGTGRGPIIPPPTEVAVHIVSCEAADKCHNFVHCASHTHSYLRAKDRCCLIRQQQNNKGICCSGHSTSPPQGNPSGHHFNPYPVDKSLIPDIPESSLATAALKGYEYKEKYQRIEDRLLELNIIVERGTAAYGHLQFFQTTPAAIRTTRDNFLVVKACNYLQDTYFLSANEAGVGLQGYDFGGTIFEKTCPPIPSCASVGGGGHRGSKTYRTFDGSCNNPDSPKLGQSSTPLIRLLPPDYADGIWAPRVRKDGTPLPSARFISRSLVPDVNQPDPRYTHLVMQFGQFLDHDLSHVPIFRFGDNSGIQCCPKRDNDGGEHVTDGIQHPACFPIDVPPGDPYLGECVNFVRSMIAPRIDCTFGHADQLNQLTHWLDASQIYGSTNEQAESLREFSGGRLKVSRDPNGRMDLLPEDLKDEDADCSSSGQNLHCFQAGDRRVNEQIGLTSIHTIFVREHNRVAGELGHLNGHWDDEVIFQEARRIVIAEYQHIIYNEWLPVIIGRDYMVTFGILPLYDGYYTGYDSGVDASVSNAFTTAAFRMGHTLVQGSFNLETGSGQTVGRLLLRDFFNNPHLLRQAGVIDLLNKGLLTQPIQRFDNFVTTELRDHLFQVRGQQGGMDLIALNIQRGRDHGLPSYNEYRDLCRLGKARDFSDLAPVIHPRKISALQSIYASVDDIDLFIGGIHETPENGAVVGPTFACIIGDQFVRSKKGDRYFHDNGNQPHSFSREQLHSIRRASMARILCDNSDEIRSVQPLAFYLSNNGFNPMLPCGSPSIPHVDLRLWRE